jgi:hypothetical protein
MRRSHLFRRKHIPAAVTCRRMSPFSYCLILGFATEYSTSVRKFTAT